MRTIFSGVRKNYHNNLIFTSQRGTFNTSHIELRSWEAFWWWWGDLILNKNGNYVGLESNKNPNHVPRSKT